MGTFRKSTQKALETVEVIERWTLGDKEPVYSVDGGKTFHPKKRFKSSGVVNPKRFTQPKDTNGIGEQNG